MTRWQQTLEVARWEFSRFVKIRQQFIGLGLLLAFGLGGAYVGRRIKEADRQPVDVVAVGATALGFALPEAPPVRWDTMHTYGADAARAAVRDGSLDGALIVRGATDVEIVVRKRAEWM